MAEIMVTPSQVHSKADELRQLNAQFQTKLEALVSSEANLIGMWEGQARDAFHSAFSNDHAQMETFHSTIEQYAAALDTIATEYENRETANVQIASERSY